MLVSPFWKQYDQVLIGLLIALLAFTYFVLILKSFSAADFSAFGSIEGIQQLFRNPFALTAGWIHYLAFDLFVGIWIKKNADYHGIHHLLVLPCLFFTFMLGPVGLLLYLFIRWIKTGTYWNENHLSID